MLETLLSKTTLTNKDLDLQRLHQYIREEKKNTLLYRTIYFLLAAREYSEDYSKEIYADINSSFEDPDFDFISKLYLNKEEKKQPETKTKLSKKEKILFDALIESKYERSDLIIMIYGEDCDFLKAETSFKSLLYRFKKKLSSEIYVSIDGIYSIAS